MLETGFPWSHVHVFVCTQLSPLRKYPFLQDAHLAVLCVAQAVPVAGVPPEHVQTFFEQTRLREVVGDVDSY